MDILVLVHDNERPVFKIQTFFRQDIQALCRGARKDILHLSEEHTAS